MDWSSNHTIITAQLNSSSPERVFEALEEYGLTRDRGWYCGIDILEQTLAARNNKLIDLGLAKNGFDDEIAAGLYMRARCGSDDPIHDKAIRLACLLNPNVAGIPGFDLSVLLKGELDRLIREGDNDEIGALMQNIQRRELVAQAFGKTGPFADLEEARWFSFVAFAVDNPRLAYDDSNYDGADIDALAIQSSLFLLVKQAPVNARWARVISRILFKIDPGKLRIPSSEAESWELLVRWGSLDMSGDGYYTHLPRNVEFQILLAIMFGGYMVSHFDSRTIGSATDPDQIMRCAYYARSPMTEEEMKSAHVKDGSAFLFAAVFNNIINYPPVRRKYLESMLSDELRLLYDQRNKIQVDIEPNDQTSKYQMESIASGITEIKSQIQSSKSYLLIWLISLVLLILVRH